MLHYPPVEVEQNGINSDRQAYPFWSARLQTDKIFCSNEIRAGAHTDYGSITILFQHIVSGLQVHRNGSWIDVAPRKGCVVINIGDALEFWSGGLFKVGHGWSKRRLNIANFPISPLSIELSCPAPKLKWLLGTVSHPSSPRIRRLIIDEPLSYCLFCSCRQC